MPSSLATIRARVQSRLGIGTDQTVLTDAELNDAIADALLDLSALVPRQRTASVATTASTDEIDVSTGYNDLVRFTAVEHPEGNRVRSFRSFEVNAGIIRITDDPLFDGTNATLYYDALHVINGTSTLPERFDAALILAACMHASQAKAAVTSNKVNVAGGAAPQNWGQVAERFEKLYERRKPRALRRRRLYSGSDRAEATQDTDPGP